MANPVPPPCPPRERRVWFSLVLFRHRLAAIQPLLASIGALSAQAGPFRPGLAVYDGSPQLPDLPSAAAIQAEVPQVPLRYTRGANLGYGRAHNRNFAAVAPEPDDLFLVTNPDIRFDPGELIPLLHWVAASPAVACAAPLVLGENGAIQHSAKHNPTLLSLALGRLSWLRRLPPLARYHRWHTNAGRDYASETITSPYLSGCFLVIPARSYAAVGGFCPRYFLHLEDADLSRRLAARGLTVHSPAGRVVHAWARGSHRSLRQTLSLLRSMLVYASLWGLPLL